MTIVFPLCCRLNHDEHIQMVTALVLQLIQCIIKLPQKSEDEDEEEEDTTAQDVIVATSYEQAMKTAHHFLSVFLKKCVPHSLLLYMFDY